MKKAIINASGIAAVVLTVIFFNSILFAQPNTELPKKYPVTLDSDTLFYLYTGIGVLSAEKRADEITVRLNGLAKNDSLSYDSIAVAKQDDYLILKLADEPIMAITRSDAQFAATTDASLAETYRGIIIRKLNATREIYSRKALIKNSLYSFLYLFFLIIFFWSATKIFPWLYKKIRLLDLIKIKAIKLKNREIISSPIIIKALITVFKGLRFALSLLAPYLFITKTLKLWPYTRQWDLQPIIKSIALIIFYTVLFIALIKGITTLVKVLSVKYESWKGTKIKPLKIRSYEILSTDRTIDFLTSLAKIIRFGVIIILSYLYIIIAFSLFSFSSTWADTLFGYVLTPLKTVSASFLNFLPNIFFIAIIIFVFKYAIKMVEFFFLEIDKGNLELPGFYKDWAMPTFKIVRFMILALALIIIFPYLPGSDSPFFKGISIFLGILFSLGSSSAIGNMVAGIVLTYMRPFKLGDRVKIADTMGDVIEKTLLVTRIRTIKNVDITIPNAMVLGSHIINYSSSAKDKGLILHTTVTIGYDAPWRQIHELLIAAACETEFVLKEPEPFVLQTSLDDFYVSYELNVYINESVKMALIYSDLHSKIQDKFNEAGVEIMSPHYGAMRDGNQIAIPQEYLQKEYQAPSFRLFGVNLFGRQDIRKD
jgi:small-conductance mechanosensitive channel